jgi:hypothetical protein
MTDRVIGRLGDNGACDACQQPFDDSGDCPMTVADIRLDRSRVICTIYMEAKP